MAIAKKGFRKINVDGECFLWKVRKKISHDEAHGEQLGVPIVHEAGGQALIGYFDYSRTHYDKSNSPRTEKITPKMVELVIRKAIELGWNYKVEGLPIAILDGKLSIDTITSKHRDLSSLEAINYKHLPTKNKPD